jgi:hypothetical protein
MSNLFTSSVGVGEGRESTDGTSVVGGGGDAGRDVFRARRRLPLGKFDFCSCCGGGGVVMDGMPLELDTSGRGSTSWCEGGIAACIEPMRLRPFETLDEVEW